MVSAPQLFPVRFAGTDPQSSSGGGGSVSVTTLNRVAGTAAGGTVLTVTGTGFSGTPSVTIGGVAATGVKVQNSSTLTCVTGAYGSSPAISGDVVDVTVGTGTLTGGYTYLPSITTNLIALFGFEDGTLGPWTDHTTSVNSTIASTDQAFLGSKSCKASYNTDGKSAGLEKHLDGTDWPATGNGHWTHFYVYIPQATTDNVGSGQIKFTLNRNSDNNGNPVAGNAGYCELGIGGQAVNGATGPILGMIGDTAAEEQIGSHFTYTPAVWLEVLQHLYKTGGQGTVQWWCGQSGQLAYMGSNSSTAYGTSTVGMTRFYSFIVPFSQGGTYPMSVYVDELRVDDGCAV